jgi:two-component system response regulator AtoC
MSEKPRILIIDDERNTREGLRRALKAKYTVALADNGESGYRLLADEHFDLILTDLRMPGLDGMSFIRRVNTMDAPPLCIMLTAYGSIENAVEAMKAGAYDYLMKPVNLDNLEMLVERALESRSLKQENKRLKIELADRYAFKTMIGKSPAMLHVIDALKQAAPARSTVLLTGENGTGKDLAARTLHNLSNRAEKPFVAVNCAALATNLLESELFGHEKDAFTGANARRAGRFEHADGGTFFLDEISEIDSAVQVKLLRVLESRSFERVGGNDPIDVDIRLIAATNRDLKQMVNDGTFRQDLYFRLSVLPIHIPALRDRKDDIPLIVRHFLDIFAKENDKNNVNIAPEALDTLIAFAWPGNVRELRNCIERMVVMSSNEVLSIADVPHDIRDAAGTVSVPVSTLPAAGNLDMETNERNLIVQALRNCNGNRSAAARELGISRRTLHRKINQFELRDM